MKDRLDRFDPAVVGGLRDQGLLYVLEPETFVDKAAAEKLAAALTEVISSGALDDLPGVGTAYEELAASRVSKRPALPPFSHCFQSL